MRRLQAFDEEGLSRIRQAVAGVEEETGCEIVTYIVAESDAYSETAWKGAALGAGLAAVALGGWAEWAYPWGGMAFWSVPLAVLVGLAVGWFVGGSGPVRRFAAGRTMEERVAERAERAFLEEEVFRTEARDGLLLLFSLLERRVVILADEGLHQGVPVERWPRIAAAAAEDMARGPGPEAVVAGVERVGRLLSEAGFRASEQDRNELADEPRVRGE